MVGAVFTTSAIPTWYQSLNKPFFTPPNWVFAPVWTFLYALMGMAFFLVARYGRPRKLVWPAIAVFGAQLLCTILWSVVFFGFKEMWVAMVIIIMLWILIRTTMHQFRRLFPAAAWLLAPYLLWVTFAGLLNLSLALLN